MENRTKLSPAEWPEGDLETYHALNSDRSREQTLAKGRHGMVAGTTGAPAVRAGVEALKQGGSAVDAALTTALAQICLAAGCWVSYAGIMTMTYCEAATGTVHSLNAGYNTFREEKQPLTIPRLNGEPSGRTAMVPGFFAGVQAAHERFGRLPFAALFEPAIYFAEQGFPWGPIQANSLAMRKDVLSRLDGTRAIFTKENGEFYGAGDTFKQPTLAATLRAVAEQGQEYIYRGEWAQKFIRAVRAEGGQVVPEDLSEYKAIWTPPMHSTYNGFDVYSMGFPTYGGVSLLEGLNLIETARLPELGHWTESAVALFRFIQITRAFYYLSYFGALFDVTKHFPGLDLSMPARIKKETAVALWERIEKNGWAPVETDILQTIAAMASGANHSDAVVAVDPDGNVATICHTINTVSWGTTGIFVDGISIPDSASFQQEALAAVEPGSRLPDPTNPGLILKDGVPLLGFSSIGGGLHEKTMQTLVNVLEYGMNPQQAVDTPSFMGPPNAAADPSLWAKFGQQCVGAGDFDSALLAEVERLGRPIRVLETREEQAMQLGYWLGIQIDRDSGELLGGVSNNLTGLADGF